MTAAMRRLVLLVALMAVFMALFGGRANAVGRGAVTMGAAEDDGDSSSSGVGGAGKEMPEPSSNDVDDSLGSESEDSRGDPVPSSSGDEDYDPKDAEKGDDAAEGAAANFIEEDGSASSSSSDDGDSSSSGVGGAGKEMPEPSSNDVDDSRGSESEDSRGDPVPSSSGDEDYDPKDAEKGDDAAEGAAANFIEEDGSASSSSSDDGDSSSSGVGGAGKEMPEPSSNDVDDSLGSESEDSRGDPVPSSSGDEDYDPKDAEKGDDAAEGAATFIAVDGAAVRRGDGDDAGAATDDAKPDVPDTSEESSEEDAADEFIKEVQAEGEESGADEGGADEESTASPGSAADAPGGDVSSSSDSSSSSASVTMNDVVNDLLTGRRRTPTGQVTVALGNSNYKQVSAKKTVDRRREERIKKKSAATAEDIQEQSLKVGSEQKRKLNEIEMQRRAVEGRNKAFELALRQKDKQHEERSEEATEKRVAAAKATAARLELERKAAEKEVRERSKAFAEKLDLRQRTHSRRLEAARKAASEQYGKSGAHAALDAERVRRNGVVEQAAKARKHVQTLEAERRRVDASGEQANKQHRRSLVQSQGSAIDAENKRSNEAEERFKAGHKKRAERHRSRTAASLRSLQSRTRSEQESKARHKRSADSWARSNQLRGARSQAQRENERRVAANRAATDKTKRSEQLQKHFKPRWRRVAENVCFGAASGVGGFNFRPEGRRTAKVTKWRLRYRSGGVTCANGAARTHWGCGTQYIGTFLLNAQRKWLAPTAGSTSGYTDKRIGTTRDGQTSWYGLTGHGPQSRELVFSGSWELGPSQLYLGYGEAITGFTTGDNSGSTCAEVWAYY